MAGNACVRHIPWSTLSDKIAWRHTGAKQFCQTTLTYDRLQTIEQLSIKLFMKFEVSMGKNGFLKGRLILASESRRRLRVNFLVCYKQPDGLNVHEGQYTTGP